MDSGHSTEESRHYTENSLTLLAACYLRMDGVNNWPHVLELLDYGGYFLVTFCNQSFFQVDFVSLQTTERLI